jgi:hypothetical protein
MKTISDYFKMMVENDLVFISPELYRKF